MAEDRTSNPQALPPSSGQAVTSGGAPSSTGTEQTSGQPVNLQELPEFRKYQSERDRGEAQLRAQNAEMARAIEEAKLAGMDDYDKSAYMAAKYQERATAAEQELNRIKQDEMKAKDIARLAEEYGVPKRLLERAYTYDDAEAIAKEAKAMRDEEVSKAVKERGDKVARNSPDMGGVGFSRADTSTNVEAQRALERNDPVALTRALREAKEQRR